MIEEAQQHLITDSQQDNLNPQVQFSDFLECNCLSTNQDLLFFNTVCPNEYVQSIRTKETQPSEIKVSQNQIKCLFHNGNLKEVETRMKCSLLDGEGGQSSYKDAEIKNKNKLKLVCGRVMKEEIGFFCKDCFKDNKAIICEQCYDLSDHYGHRAFFKNIKQGRCDCGEDEHLHSNAKVGCSTHKGLSNQKEIERLEPKFEQRLSSFLNDWFRRLFQSSELNEYKREIIRLEYQNRLLQCILSVISYLDFEDSAVISSLEFIFSQKNNQKSLTESQHYYYYHDCKDKKKIVPPLKQKKDLQSCSCSILDLILRFMMNQFRENINIKDLFLKMMKSKSFKIIFAQSFTNHFLFIHSVPINISIQQRPFAFLHIKNEVFCSEYLCLASYQTNETIQIFSRFLQVCEFFKNTTNEGAIENKQPSITHFLHYLYIIKQLLKEPSLFQQFILNNQLFHCTLEACLQFDSILLVQHALQMPQYSPVSKEVYSLYQGFSSEKSLINCISTYLIPIIEDNNISGQQHALASELKNYLIYYLKCMVAKLKNRQNFQHTQFPIYERTFFYLFFAYFENEISLVNQEKLNQLAKDLAISEEEFKVLLLLILKRSLVPISLFHENNHKMWLYSGNEFEVQTREYALPQYEAKVIDSLICKVISLLYPIEHFWSMMPQNVWTRALLKNEIQQLLLENQKKLPNLQEAASNMVEKAFGSFADFLNFMCYNICVQIDISYYKCIQFFYTSHELQENILSLSNDYFATLLNLMENQGLDCKALYSFYEKDFGKKSPALLMLKQVGTIQDSNSSVKVNKEFEGKYNPYNFLFNTELRNKYFEIFELTKEKNKRFDMMFGNIPLTEEGKIIARNTVTSELFEFLKQFLQFDFNKAILNKNLKLKENILYPILKLAMIFLESNNHKEESSNVIKEFLIILRKEIPEEQFSSFISTVEMKIQVNSQNKENQSESQLIEEQKDDEKKVLLENKKKLALQRQKEIMERFNKQQNKFKQSQTPLEQLQSSSGTEVECCSFCKEPLSQSPFGLLVSLQKNNFHSQMLEEQLMKTIEKQGNAKELLEEWRKEKKRRGEMVLMNTCDHKIHSHCLQGQVGYKNIYDQKTEEFEVKCRICNQFMNFFLEIKEITVFETEAVQEDTKQQQPQQQANQIKKSSFHTSYEDPFESSYHQDNYLGYDYQDDEKDKYSHNFSEQKYQYGAFNNVNQERNMIDESNDEVVDIVYKKVKLEDDRYRLFKSFDTTYKKISRIEKNTISRKKRIQIYNQQLQEQKNMCANQNIQNPEFKSLIEFDIPFFSKLNEEINLKFSSRDQKLLNDIEKEENGMKFTHNQEIKENKASMSEQLIFYEQALGDEIKYLDLASKIPDSNNSMIKVARAILSSTRNTFALIEDKKEVEQIIRIREKFVGDFAKMFQIEEIIFTKIKVQKQKNMINEQSFNSFGNQYGSNFNSSYGSFSYNNNQNQMNFMQNPQQKISFSQSSYEPFPSFATNNNSNSNYCMSYGSNNQNTDQSWNSNQIKKDNNKNSSNDNQLRSEFVCLGTSCLNTNISDSYLNILMFESIYQAQSSINLQPLLKKTLPNVMKQLYIQATIRQCILEPQTATAASEEILFSFVLSFLKRVLVWCLICQPLSENPSLDKLINNLPLQNSDYKQICQNILSYFSLSIEDIIPTNEQIEFAQKQSSSKMNLTLSLLQPASFTFHLINLPENYLLYSSQNYKRKCDYCKRIPLVFDLCQCLICGMIMCLKSCIGHKYSNLNMHSDACHGGQSLFINTQSGVIFAIANSHNTLLINYLLYINSLKQEFSINTKQDWKTFVLNTSLVQPLKKQLFELNIRNLIAEDHLKRIEYNISIISHDYF